MEQSSLLEKLNLFDKNGLCFYDDLYIKKTDFLPIRTKETLRDILKPSAFFCINNEPLILFFDNPINIIELQQQVWNFNQSPAVFINTSKGWIIKNGFNLLHNKKELEDIGNNISDFEYFKIITGKTWEEYKFKFEQKNRVDSYLLDNIETTRKILINDGLHPKIANSLIGRVIFIRYLIDRLVELNVYGVTSKEDFYNILDNKEGAYSFFQQIKNDFNGNLFPLDYIVDNIRVIEKDKITPYHLLKIKELLQGGKLHNDGSYQSSLFDIYDFSIIPIEFVSNVYEKFIGFEKQADTGAYYTPLFLVNYIQKETVSKYFRENPTEYNCKVLDPACGSGVFLVETLRQVISQYILLNPFNAENELEYNVYKEKLKTLLTDNIFGIDKDENSVSVAIFSLYITLLDNLKPKSIVGFRFPPLENTNFFTADFFDTNHIFNTELKQHNFQYILGNPPWATKHPKPKQEFEKYIENRRKIENSNLEIIHREIAEAFLVRVSDFSFKETAFIVASKVLYKLEKKGTFRNYFLNKFAIRQVVELSSVRHHIFNESNDSAVAPASILFYKKESSIELLRKNIIKHISLKPNIFFETFKLMVIEKYDVKEIAQEYFIDEDWIWKVLVYGNILDYYFIKRLKLNFKTIEQITDNGFIRREGLKRVDGNKRNDVSNLIGKPFINTQKKELKKYYINTSEKWEEKTVGFCPKQQIFKPPILLSTRGVNNKFGITSAISYEDVIFTHSLFAIKAEKEKDIHILKSISAIWNSSLVSAYITLTGSSIGIEREQLHVEEKLNIPFITNNVLVDLYSEAELISAKYFSQDIADYGLIENELISTVKKIDLKLIELFGLSSEEKSLIDYTNTITIPLLKGKEIEKKKVISKLKEKDILLKDYAQIFIDHFSKRFNSEGHYFEVEIIYSNHTILMKFKIIPNPSTSNDLIIWSKQGDKELLKNIASFGFENLSDNLYLQKDIKGFEEDYFYIAKPNQYKSWHTALAYLDLSEFIEALHNFSTNNPS